MAQKKWRKPELIEIVRGKPEEAVLTACKVGQPGTSSPSAPGIGCQTLAPGPCAFCEYLAAS